MDLRNGTILKWITLKQFIIRRNKIKKDLKK